MNSLFLALMAPAQGGDAGGGMISTVLMFAVIIFIFYFMIIRPQNKRQKERQKMIQAMKKGDKVLTNSGIHGKIVGLEEKFVLVEIAENVKVKMEKTAIGAIIPE